MSGPSVSDAATGRLLGLLRGLRGAVTLRRHERRLSTYFLRLTCLGLLLVVLPLEKLVRLGPLDAVLALLKVGAGAALVAGVLWLAFVVEEFLRRRRGDA